MTTGKDLRARPLIDAFDFARSGGHLEGDVEVARLQRLAESLLNTDAILHYQIDGLMDDQGYLGAQMQLSGHVSLMCQRCNSPLTFDLNRTTRFRFVSSEQELNALPIDDEADAVIGSAAMDVIAWVEDEAILSLPLVPRHQECSLAMPIEVSGDAARRNPFADLAAALKSGGSNGPH